MRFEGQFCSYADSEIRSLHVEVHFNWVEKTKFIHGISCSDALWPERVTTTFSTGDFTSDGCWPLNISFVKNFAFKQCTRQKTYKLIFNGRNFVFCFLTWRHQLNSQILLIDLIDSITQLIGSRFCFSMPTRSRYVSSTSIPNVQLYTSKVPKVL